LGEQDALAAGAGHLDGGRRGRGLDGDPVDHQVLAGADQRLVVGKVDAVGFRVGAGALAQVDNVALADEDALKGIEVGDRREGIGLGAEIGAVGDCVGTVVDEPHRRTDGDRDRAGVDEIVGVAGDAVEAGVAQGVSEGVGALEADRRDVGEGAVGVERDEAELVAQERNAGVLNHGAGVEREPLGAERLGVVGEHAHRGGERHIAGGGVAAVVEGDRRDVDVVVGVAVAALVDQRHAVEVFGELHAGGVGRRRRRVVGDSDGGGDDVARIDHAIDVVVGRQHGGLRRREGLVGHVVTSYGETSTRSAGVATAADSTPPPRQRLDLLVLLPTPAQL